MTSMFKLSAAPALAAALSLTIAPAAAAELSVSPAPRVAVDADPVWTPAGETAANHGWRRYRRNRVDAGDVLAGVLIVGGIAAIASAATRHRDYRYRDRNGDWRYRGRDRDWREDYRYRDYRGNRYGDDFGRGLDSAVDMCVAEVERDNRVARVDSVEREGDGWRVSGSLHDGAGFSCSIGEDGRIGNIDTGARADPYRSGEADGSRYGEDRQWDDDRYSAERERIEGSANAAAMPRPLPEGWESEDMRDPGADEADADEAGGGEMEVGNGYPGAD